MAATNGKEIPGRLVPRKHKLTVRHFIVLALLQQKKRISVKRMAKLFGVHTSAIHGVVNGLVKHGFATYKSSWVIINDKPVRVGFVHLVEKADDTGCRQ